MTDLVARPDLIPPHDARPVPTALVAVDGRLDDIDIADVIATRDVDNCPPEYLKFLAWGVGVDVWDDAWSVATKRAVIKASPIVKRHKGTRYAVETALSALGIATEIVEWWQASPRKAPYTFSVTAVTGGRLYGGAVLDARLIRVAQAAVMAAKPTSRAFSLDVAAGTTGTLGLAPVAVVRSRASVAVRSRCSEFFASGLALAPVAVARARASASIRCRTSEFFATRIGLAPVAVARLRVAVSMVARAA